MISLISPKQWRIPDFQNSSTVCFLLTISENFMTVKGKYFKFFESLVGSNHNFSKFSDNKNVQHALVDMPLVEWWRTTMRKLLR
jgi:hypothetical protein